MKISAKKVVKNHLSKNTLDLIRNLKKPKAEPKANSILNQDVQISDFPSSTESKKTEEKVVITPKYTKQTEDIINQLKAEQPKTSTTTPTFGLTAREKHQDLLSVTKRLVMPAQYRALKDMARYIDISLNFLKSRKTTAGIQVSNQTFIPFSDIKNSVSITQRK